jgi:tripartite-type tricarboxylate transporter receptor subunit TctC
MSRPLTQAFGTVFAPLGTTTVRHWKDNMPNRIIPRARLTAVSLSAVIAAIAALTNTAPAQTGDYAGKTVRLVVGSSAGGGYDTNARSLAPFLAQHLPGKPNVVVQNMPGGGGWTSVAYLEANAPKDGTVISLFNPGIITDAATNPAQAKVNLAKMAWIGSVSRAFRACYFWHATGLKSWKELDRKRLITLGATGLKSASYNDAAMLKNLLGQNLRTIYGYPGRSEVALAIERGEVDGECGSSETFPPALVAERKMNLFMRMSEAKTPDIPDYVPWIGEFVQSDEDLQALKLLVAGYDLGRPIVASPQVPAAQIEMLRAAFEASMADPNYLAVAKKRLLAHSPMSGNEAQKVITQILDAPKQVSDRAREVVK